MNIKNEKETNLHFRRFEWKYIIDKAKMDQIIGDLSSHMQLDPYAPELNDSPNLSYYVVRSVYMENSALSTYHEKKSGIDYRRKLRIRSYKEHVNENEKVFLEIKRKKGDVILKDRMQISYNDCRNMHNHEDIRKLLPNKNNLVLQEYVWLYNRSCMKPYLNITYKRIPYVGKIRKKFRITFDYDILAELTNGHINFSNNSNKKNSQVVMEVKYNGTLPIWFYHLIKKHNLSRSSFSKYCYGIEQVHNLK